MAFKAIPREVMFELGFCGDRRSVHGACTDIIYLRFLD